MNIRAVFSTNCPLQEDIDDEGEDTELCRVSGQQQGGASILLQLAESRGADYRCFITLWCIFQINCRRQPKMILPLLAAS